MQRFDDDNEPYRSLVHPMWKARYGDYDHLARVKEWSATGGPEDDIPVRMNRRTAMRSPSIIPPDVLQLQGDVSDPAVSAWVAANAGSGKTHVLAQRVINLLLAGVQPEKILCLTFTKAAAANMAKRVFDTLGRWTTLDDDALDAAIGEQGGQSGRRPPGAGAAAFCPRAGDAGRSQGADHPRLLHAASASVSVRSERRRPLHRARRDGAGGASRSN